MKLIDLIELSFVTLLVLLSMSAGDGDAAGAAVDTLSGGLGGLHGRRRFG